MTRSCSSGVRAGTSALWRDPHEPQPGFIPFCSFSVVQADETPAGGALETQEERVAEGLAP